MIQDRSTRGEGRFSRFSLISWWDQERLRQAKIVVVGAGALGNEVLKNLALLGVGRLVVIDLDDVELSNLSRSVLFRQDDIGRPKAAAAAAAVGSIHAGSRASSLQANVGHAVGLGLFRWADVTIGAVDNREARLAINRWCALAGRPWIDGGIDVLSGLARVFLPGEGPCYECTLSEEDWKIIERRRACSLLPRDDSGEPRVPTTPTTAAIVAGVQCSEAVKLLHGMEGLAGEGFQFDGLGYDSYRVRYRRDPECFGHESLPCVEALPLRAAGTTVGQVTMEAERHLGPGAEVEACRELIAGLQCTRCGSRTPAAGALGSIGSDAARCAGCGEPAAPILYRSLSPEFCRPDATLASLGIPRWDILRARRGNDVMAIELAADGPEVLEQEVPIT